MEPDITTDNLNIAPDTGDKNLTTPDTYDEDDDHYLSPSAMTSLFAIPGEDDLTEPHSKNDGGPTLNPDAAEWYPWTYLTSPLSPRTDLLGHDDRLRFLSHRWRTKHVNAEVASRPARPADTAETRGLPMNKYLRMSPKERILTYAAKIEGTRRCARRRAALSATCSNLRATVLIKTLRELPNTRIALARFASLAKARATERERTLTELAECQRTRGTPTTRGKHPHTFRSRRQLHSDLRRRCRETLLNLSVKRALLSPDAPAVMEALIMHRATSVLNVICNAHPQVLERRRNMIPAVSRRARRRTQQKTIRARRVSSARAAAKDTSTLETSTAEETKPRRDRSPPPAEVRHDPCCPSGNRSSALPGRAWSTLLGCLPRAQHAIARIAAAVRMQLLPARRRATGAAPTGKTRCAADPASPTLTPADPLPLLPRPGDPWNPSTPRTDLARLDLPWNPSTPREGLARIDLPRTSYSLYKTMASAATTPPPLQLDFAEIFSGAGGTTRACKTAGLRCAPPFDILNGRTMTVDADTTMNTMDLHEPIVRNKLITALTNNTPRVIFAAPPCKNWCSYSKVAMKRHGGEATTRRREREMANWVGPLLKLFREECVKKNTYFMLEQPATSTMVSQKPMTKLLALKSTHVIAVDQCAFGRDVMKPTVFVTNIPLSFCGPLMRKRCNHKKHAARTEAARTSATAEYPAALCNALAQVMKNAAYPRNSSIDGHAADHDTLLRAHVAYATTGSSTRATHKAVVDTGCQHSLVNKNEWATLSHTGESVRTTSWCGTESVIPIGTACARTTTTSGVPVLLVINNAGLSDQRSLLDPFQIEANGWQVQLTEHGASPLGMRKGGLQLGLSFEHDVALDTVLPTATEIASLPRIELTSPSPWSRHEYCRTRAPAARIGGVSAEKEQFPDVPDDYHDLILKHRIPATRFPWLTDKVRTAMEKSTTNMAFSGQAHRGVGKHQHRQSRPAAMAFRRLRDRVTTDTGFSTVASRDGFKKFQLFAAKRSRLLHYVPLRSKDEAFGALQDFCAQHGCPDSLHSDNAKELKSAASTEFCRKHLILRTFTEPHHSNQNACERSIQTVKAQTYKLIEATGAPKEEWDYAMRFVVAAFNKTPHKKLMARTPHEAATGQTPDISEFGQFNFYDQVVFRPHGGNFPADRLQRARYLGPATNQGSEFCHTLRLPTNALVVSSTVQLAGAGPPQSRGGEEEAPQQESGDYLKVQLRPNDGIVEGPDFGSVEHGAMGDSAASTEDDMTNDTDNESPAPDLPEEPDDNATQASLPTTGSRVRVWYDDLMKFVHGTVTSTSETKASVKFDDGDEDNISGDDDWGYEQDEPNREEPAREAPNQEEPDPEEPDPEEPPTETEGNVAFGDQIWMSIDGTMALGTVTKAPDARGNYTLAFNGHGDVPVNTKDSPLSAHNDKSRMIMPHESEKGELDFAFDEICGYKTVGNKLKIQILWSDGNKTLEAFENIREDSADELAAYLLKKDDERPRSVAPSGPMRKATKWAREQSLATRAIAARTNAVKGNMNGRPAQGMIKFGNYVPKGVKDALRADKILDSDENLSAACKGQRWMAAIQKELVKFFDHKAMHFLEPGQRAPEGFQKMNVHFVFDCKSDGTYKARLCANGNRVDSTGVESSMTVIQTHHSRALMAVGRRNGQRIWCSDLAAAYLHAVTEERVFFQCGPEWGPEYEGRNAIVQKCVYGLVGSGAGFHKHVFEQMHRLGFKPSEADADIWYRLDETNEVYDYVGFYSDDYLTISHHPDKIAKEIANLFTVKTAGPLGGGSYLGADVDLVGEDYYCSAGSYIKEAIERLKREMVLAEAPRHTPVTPVPGDHHPELDDSELLGTDEHRLYMRLIGTLNWIVLVGRFDIAFATSSMARFSSAPRATHLADVKKIFAYLDAYPDLAVRIDPRDPVYMKEQPVSQTAELHQKFPYAAEELSSRMPVPKGAELPLTVYVDADHGDDRETRRSRTGLIAFLGRTPIMAKSKRQTSVETSTFSAEFNAARTGAETIIGLRFFLRSIGVPVTKPSRMMGDNEGCVTNATAFKSSLQKKHVAISFLRTREAIATGALTFEHVATNENLADVFTKPLGGLKFWGIAKQFLHDKSPAKEEC